MKYFCWIFFIIIFYLNVMAQSVVTIDSLRYNDATGVPIGIGHVFTISGIVTSSNQFGSSGPASVRDDLAGVSVYGQSFVSEVSIGDSVTLTGELAQFSGLTEINFTLGGASVEVHSSGNVFDTTVVTLNEIKTQQWNGYEAFEGMLVRVNNVTIQATGNFAGGTNYDISDPKYHN